MNSLKIPKQTNIILVNSPIDNYIKKSYKNFKKEKYTSCAPLGLGYLATISKLKGFNTFLLDAEYLKLSINQIILLINNSKAKIVGFNITTPSYKLIKKIISKLDKNKFVIVGGSHATLNPKQVLEENKRINILFRGESEISFSQFLDKFPNKEIYNIKGISYLKYNKYVEIGKKRLITNLDKLPFIDRTFFLNEPYITNKSKEMSISTSRGCPNKCVFCSVPILNGNKIRARSIQNILKEIKSLKKNFTIESIHFVDDNFLYSKERIINFCKSLNKNKINIKWRAIGTINCLDYDTLKLMKESGCYLLGFGVESMCERTLKMIMKPINLKKLKKIINHCKKLDIKTKAFFTIGYPNETKKEINQTIKKATKFGFNEAYFMIVRAYPGTKLYQLCKAQGYDVDHYHQFNKIINRKDSTPTIEKINSLTRYHLSNKSPLNKEYNLEELNNIICKAYSSFYGVQ